MAEQREYATFAEVRERLDQIVDAVNADGISLDEALALYEEAVKLGLSACDLSERDVEVSQASIEAPGAQGGSDERSNS